MARGNDSREPLHVAVGMSGGVDSSLAAHLLLQQGHQVTGVFIRSWEDDGNCPAGADAVAAAATAAHLGIELESIDLVAEYRDRVFADFLAELRNGRTPNPDVWCNAVIKFAAFADYALTELGADAFATGHYARVDGSGTNLLKAEDDNKDQTYFLYRMPVKQLPKVLFPLGELRKTEVRELAKAAQLPSAERAESMGICFVGKRPFREFVADYIDEKPGELMGTDGAVLGSHPGAHLYTIGQRHGLGLGGPGEPWYVCAKDMPANTVTVVRGREAPQLYASTITLDACHWLAAKAVRCNWVYTCRFRHRMEPAPCTLTSLSAGTATIEFAEPQWGIAPGQAGVLYDGITCLGGGTIMATKKVK